MVRVKVTLDELRLGKVRLGKVPLPTTSAELIVAKRRRRRMKIEFFKSAENFRNSLKIRKIDKILPNFEYRSKNSNYFSTRFFFSFYLKLLDSSEERRQAKI